MNARRFSVYCVIAALLPLGVEIMILRDELWKADQMSRIRKDIHIDLLFDKQGRLMTATPFYTNGKGMKIRHGDVVEMQGDSSQKSVTHYVDGEEVGLSQLPISLIGNELYPEQVK